MTQSFESAKSRLENIKTIEPLLSALRTMSMGVWQMANRKIASLSNYEDDLDQILIEILPKFTQKPVRAQTVQEIPIANSDTIILIIGSERGLCGKFNVGLVENTLKFIDQNQFSSYQIWVMGSRLRLEFERREMMIAWRKELPASGLFTYHEAYMITQDWLDQFEAYAFHRLIVLNNHLVSGSLYQFEAHNLLPFEFERDSKITPSDSRRWPPVIIETDPMGIYNQVIQHFIAASFYKLLLRSAVAEHSARYHLLQEASENAEDIIEDLIWVINAERKRKITQQMQELAVSAGLLKY